MRQRGSLEMWGGVECTIARIGDRWRDQLRETGHRDRGDDLDRIASLGLTTVRYPILWETVAPQRPDRLDFGWHDARLGRLRELGIEPLAGLVHHGSGPSYTDLLDPAFPRRLARYAGQVARRYPWITSWTPVNEPLTTARFSCLYGHWYPHRCTEQEFLAALANQCRGILLAMRAIRRSVPTARLVQTEDLGRVFARPAVNDQADYENERRWLSFDLLSGRLDRAHPWWPRFIAAGIPARHLEELRTGEGRPDILGINHYLTSDRYLDERLDLYPPHLAGGNGRQRYADAEAVRIRALEGQTGPAARLREAWERYRTPLAVTEVHHGSTRDEQVRWLAEVWDAAQTLRGEGIDLRAVTTWALFGAADWNSLLTREAGIYEPGAFDVRGPAPRPTALATAVAAFATRGTWDHPVLDAPGWWRRADRHYGPGREGDAPRPAARRPPRQLVIVGDGAIAFAFARVCDKRGLPWTSLRHAADLDRRSLADMRCWAVVAAEETAGGPSARRSPSIALAQLCGAAGLPALVVGRVAAPSGLASPHTLTVRIGAPFGPWEPDPVVAPCLPEAAGGRPADRPVGILELSYLPDLCHVALDLLVDGETGAVDLVSGSVETSDLVAYLSGRAALGLDRAPTPGGVHDLPLMPSLASALERYVAEVGSVRLDAFGIAAE